MGKMTVSFKSVMTSSKPAISLQVTCKGKAVLGVISIDPAKEKHPPASKECLENIRQKGLKLLKNKIMLSEF